MNSDIAAELFNVSDICLGTITITSVAEEDS